MPGARQGPQGGRDSRRAASSRGFSLLELLIVASLLGVLVAAIGGTLSAGIRVWERCLQIGGEENASLVGLTLFRRDVENALVFTETPFHGDEESVTFGVLLSDEDGTPRIGTVRYRFDEGRARFVRDAWFFFENEPDPLSAETILSGVDAVSLDYGRRDPEDRACRWVPASTNFPVAIRLRAAFPPGHLLEGTHITAMPRSMEP